RSHEERLAARQREVATVGATRPVFGLIAIDDNHHSGGDDVLAETAPEQVVWITSLDHPLLNGSIRLLHIDVEPCVWIDPLDSRDGALELEWFTGVELRRESMMGQKRPASRAEADGCEDKDNGSPFLQRHISSYLLRSLEF